MHCGVAYESVRSLAIEVSWLECAKHVQVIFWCKIQTPAYTKQCNQSSSASIETGSHNTFLTWTALTASNSRVHDKNSHNCFQMFTCYGTCLSHSTSSSLSTIKITSFSKSGVNTNNTKNKLNQSRWSNIFTGGSNFVDDTSKKHQGLPIFSII